MKKIFFTADWHLGHANSIMYDNRPFCDLDHMHEVLVNNYNATVPEDGICYFLGDIIYRLEHKDVITRLNNSTKVLLLGNHDRNYNAMYSFGFDVVLNTATLYSGNTRISLSHCPKPGEFREDTSQMKGNNLGSNWHGEHKNQKFTSYDSLANVFLHGHIHSKPDGMTPKTTHNQFDVGVVNNKYRPVSLSTIESWIALR